MADEQIPTDAQEKSISNALVGEGDGDNIDHPKTEGDGILNFLVHFAHHGAEYGVTLYTQGLAISGVIISDKRYFELSRDFTATVNQSMSKVFEEFLKHVDEPVKLEDAPVPSYNFVHLRDAQIISPGQPGMPQEGTLLRIVRTDVVGWSFGQLKGVWT